MLEPKEVGTTESVAATAYPKWPFADSRRLVGDQATASVSEAMTRVPPFDPQQLTAICKALGDTADGLTGSQIGHLLADCHIPDLEPSGTKWRRLYNAFAAYQNQRQFGNHVVVFINRAMNPVQFTADRDRFIRWRLRLNEILAFSGITIGEDGKARWSKPASTLEAATARANRLQHHLETRAVHSDVLRFCSAELIQENYFHAVFEATKSIAAKIRELTGLTGDGARLVQDAFGGTPPRLAINELKTESDRSEQSGFVNLLVGVFGTVRNPLAHRPKIEWSMDEQDLLDIFTLLSLVHRKIDRARRP